MSKKLFWLGMVGLIAMVIVSVLIMVFCGNASDHLAINLFFILGFLFGMLTALQIYIYANRSR